jgi:hypothetical protein
MRSGVEEICPLYFYQSPPLRFSLVTRKTYDRFGACSTRHSKELSAYKISVESTIRINIHVLIMLHNVSKQIHSSSNKFHCRTMATRQLAIRQCANFALN